MRRLNRDDLNDITGNVIQGYKVEMARINKGEFSDFDSYGIILAKNKNGNYVTWQFHLDEEEKFKTYWGHYFSDDREAALYDYYVRDMDKYLYEVDITETLQMRVCCKAYTIEEAEEMTRKKYDNGEYVLSSEHFVGVDIKVAKDEND